MATAAPTLGSIVDRLKAKSVEIDEVTRQKKLLEKEYKDLEKLFFDAADAQETKSASGLDAAASITDTVLPHVEDWDEFYAYMHDNKYHHLLQQRLSVPGCRELFELGTKIPGVVPFTKRKINLRSL